MAAKFAIGVIKLDKLLNEGLQPSTASYTVLIENFCEARNVGETQAFRKDMVDRGGVLAVFAYDSMILGLSEQGNVAEEMQWLGTMLNSMLKPQKKTFERLVQFYLRLIGRD
ncbi:putative pentatricopeptide repeat-containing protein [Forsythia ovata]|uniref:Pentatricopeptide repeat-containing protein n=1 Tax=Forsythia ovata TaxID=205694 RepID=A0ABD1UUN7_9LAMI